MWQVPTGVRPSLCDKSACYLYQPPLRFIQNFGMVVAVASSISRSALGSTASAVDFTRSTEGSRMPLFSFDADWFGAYGDELLEERLYYCSQPEEAQFVHSDRQVYPFFRIRLQVDYSAYRVSNCKLVHKAAGGFDVILPPTDDAMVQLGYGAPDAFGFSPFSMHLRSSKYYINYFHADADLVIMHRRARHQARLRTQKTYHRLDFEYEVLVIVVPLTLDSTESDSRATNFANVLRHFAEAAEDNSVVDENATFDLQRLMEGKGPVMLMHSESECNGTVIAVLTGALLVPWLPPTIFTQPKSSTIQKVSEIIHVELGTGSFIEWTFKGEQNSQNSILFSASCVVVLVLTYVLSVGAVCWKNRQLPKEMGSLVHDLEGGITFSFRTQISTSNISLGASCPSSHSLEADQSSSDESSDCGSEETFQDDVLDAAVCCKTDRSTTTFDVANSNKLAAFLLIGFLLLFNCLLPHLNTIESAGKRGTDFIEMPPVSCYEHLPWDGYGELIALFIIVRLVDLLVYSRLPLRCAEVTCGRPFNRSVTMGFLTSGAQFANIYFDQISILVVKACESYLWKMMLIVFMFGQGVLMIVMPVASVWLDPSSKCLFRLANMSMVALCVDKGPVHDSLGHRSQPPHAKLWLAIHWFGAACLNFPMALMQGLFLLNERRDTMLIRAFLVSVITLILNLSVAVSKDVMFTLQEHGKYVVRRKLMNEMGNGDLKRIKNTLRIASQLHMEGDPQVLCAERMVQEDLQAMDIDVGELRHRLEEHAGKHEQLRNTLKVCLDLLAAGRGGAILVVLHHSLEKALNCQPLDGGSFLALMAEVCPDLCKGATSTSPCPIFSHLLESLCRHSEDDRWGLEQVSFLQVGLRKFGLNKVELCQLKHQPMDGAVILDYSGRVLNACVKLGHEQARWVLKKTDGTSAGTRHAGALGTAVWLSQQRCAGGTVFCRSDGGGVHCMFQNVCGEPPHVAYVRQVFKDEEHVEDESLRHVADVPQHYKLHGGIRSSI